MGSGSGPPRATNNPAVWPAGNLPAGCRVAPGAIHYYARLPAGSRVNRDADVVYRPFTHSDFYPAVTERSLSTAVSLEYCNSSLLVVKLGDFEFDIGLLISLVEARPALWDKTGDIYRDRN